MDKTLVYGIIHSKDPFGKFVDRDIVLAVDEVEQEVLNYCDIPVVPDALNFTVANMSIDLLEFQFERNRSVSSLSLEDIDVSDVSSLKIGDVSIGMGESRNDGVRKATLNSHKANLDDILFNYRSQLNRFRRLF